jgi:DNA-directed RNA polymerase specialized sigma24 family protein
MEDEYQPMLNTSPDMFTDAADLAQEAFIKAYIKLSSLSNPSK